MPKKEKNEKKVVNKQSQISEYKYSLTELADLFGVSILTIRSKYKIRGLDVNKKLSYDEALKIMK